MVAMLINKNNGNKYVGRVLPVTGSLKDGGGQKTPATHIELEQPHIILSLVLLDDEVGALESESSSPQPFNGDEEVMVSLCVVP